MIRFILALLVLLFCAVLTWGQTLRFFASYEQVCFGTGPGWHASPSELFARARWNSDLFLSSVFPFAPFLFFAGPKQGKLRHATMIIGMATVTIVLLRASGPALEEVCESKGPFPEIGPMLAGVFISLPIASGLAWLTKTRALRS